MPLLRKTRSNLPFGKFSSLISFPPGTRSLFPSSAGVAVHSGAPGTCHPQALRRLTLSVHSRFCSTCLSKHYQHQPCLSLAEIIFYICVHLLMYFFLLIILQAHRLCLIYSLLSCLKQYLANYRH